MFYIPVNVALDFIITAGRVGFVSIYIYTTICFLLFDGIDIVIFWFKPFAHNKVMTGGFCEFYLVTFLNDFNYNFC